MNAGPKGRPQAQHSDESALRTVFLSSPICLAVSLIETPPFLIALIKCHSPFAINLASCMQAVTWALGP